MTYTFLGPDPLESQISNALQALASGTAPHDVESTRIDVKEEPGRRGSNGNILPGQTQNEAAARYLAAEMACMANTPGGGAIIVGISDRGDRIGTELDGEWLRHRVWELTEQRLTTTIRPVQLEGHRLLVLSTHQAIEPIRYEGRIKWRVDDHCVEIDPSSWHSGRIQQTGFDWSAQQSGHVVSDANPLALEIARRYLIEAGDDSADLALASDLDLLRRLNVALGDNHLTNAGSLLFVETPTVGIDYIRRDHPGADSTARMRLDRSLLEQVFEVERSADAANRGVHLGGGFAHGQVRAIPPGAVREAIVNGVVHRNWLSPEPTTVEHVGDTLTVTSPGGFIGGIAPSNIITHPAVARYKSLAEALATLRLAEREGIGIDRMVRDMLALGHAAPEITEVAGPYVRVGLIGGDPDASFLNLLAELQPNSVRADVDALLLLRHLIVNGWIDAASAAPIVQRPSGESEASLNRLASVRLGTEPLMTPVDGVPAGSLPAWRPSRFIQGHVGLLPYLVLPEARSSMLLAWASHRGRISSTEAADLGDITVPYAGTLLSALAGDGLLQPGRANRAGRGFFYKPMA
jgi:ATP-dependent DNA helicase RecG